jgi:hypothetical protein
MRAFYSTQKSIRVFVLGIRKDGRWRSTISKNDDGQKCATVSTERSGMSHAIGPEWFDVNTPEDFQRMRAKLCQRPVRGRDGDGAD